MGRHIQVGKIDLDTVGAAFLSGVSREDEVEVLRGCQATEEDLANPEVLCIEVGGSGRVSEGNFDHHGPRAPNLPSAMKQVWSAAVVEACRKNKNSCVGLQAPAPLYKLVDYINLLDTRGPQALGQKAEGLFPVLSDLFAGLLLTEREPVEQLHKGVELLRDVVAGGWDPYGSFKGLRDSWAEAKAENNRQMAKAVEQAQWGTTASGLKLAWLGTDFFGAPGALYGNGAQVVVAFSRHFGPAGVPKFTIAGNGIKVDGALPKLNALEPGWGGPSTGTIIGSPREGSHLTLEEVVKIVKETL